MGTCDDAAGVTTEMLQGPARRVSGADRRARRARWHKQRALRVLEGTWQSSWVPAGPARARILQLREQGWSIAALEALLGESRGQLGALVYEGHHRHVEQISRQRRQRIMTLVPCVDGVPDLCHVPGLGTRRRVRALAAIGWSQPALAERLGVAQQTLAATLASDGSVTARTARRVQAVYADLEQTSGPSTRSRRHAAAQGWAPPAAWDDIDDPTEQPDPTTADTTRPGWRLTRDGLMDCASWGMTREQAAHRLGVKAGSIDRWLERHHAPELRARFARNEIAAA